jgi:hypothetical protein
MITTMDMLDGSHVPKRGDLLQTNVGDRRERTFLILHVRKLNQTTHKPRCKLWAERWWDIEPETRMRLFLSAERAGGQRVIHFTRYKPTRKRKPL